MSRQQVRAAARREKTGRPDRWVPRQPWQRMERGVRLPPDPQLAEMAERDPQVAEIMENNREVWIGGRPGEHGQPGDMYVVTVHREPQKKHVTVLSIRRTDRKPNIPWRHKQRIKNEIAGRDVEAIELYPAWSRTVDTANQTWLWCFPPGMILPLGFDERSVEGHNDPRFPMSRQSPFADREEREAI